MLIWILLLLIFISILTAALLWSRFYRVQAKLESVQQEYTDLLRKQQGITFKAKKINGEYFYTMIEGNLYYMLGQTQSDVGKRMEDLIPSHQQDLIRHNYDRVWAGETVQYEYSLNGYTCLFSLTPVKENGETVELIGVGSDITERKKAEQAMQESESRYRQLVELSPDAIFVVTNRQIVFMNKKAMTVLGGSSLEQFLARPIQENVHLEFRSRARQHLQQVLDTEGVLQPYESKYMKLNGEPIDVEVTAAYMLYQGASSVIIIFRDITERKLAEQQLQESNVQLMKLVSLDGLTGIANRRFFDEMMEKEWELALSGELPLSIILCDIDYFKAYNDTYGHQEGDSCLKLTAAVLDKIAQPNGGFAARYGGEEFIILLPETGPEEAAHIGFQLCEAVKALGIPHGASLVSPVVTICAGVTSFTPSAVDEMDELIRQADTALYQAKQSGRNRMQLYDVSWMKEGV
ncbi:sensor domain-containing diguanylate cyclase [Paenibacillus albus]|uniref:Sensor domain-containing diguanylate cyclase n=1 Tax=Paenibacillus albus TaxID=2495582 RepID=A0A3S9A0I7_9BACL|nr:sensor domain-containing diguanylate cyclase [Paenibacillus albus]AZN39260.1 sensor domain-containing diguanylate cyclase [Paenibacillus albus]